MNETVYLWLAILICALITFLLRLAPFALFSGKRKMPPAVEAVAQRMPAAIIAVLVIFCVKGLPASERLPVEGGVTLAAITSVVLLHLWKKNVLISIAGGTAVYMILLRVAGL